MREQLNSFVVRMKMHLRIIDAHTDESLPKDYCFIYIYLLPSVDNLRPCRVGNTLKGPNKGKGLLSTVDDHHVAVHHISENCFHHMPWL